MTVVDSELPAHGPREPDYLEATFTLMERTEDSDVVRGLAEEANLNEYQALVWITLVQAAGHLPSDRTRGQEAEGLSVWHRQVKNLCSTRYADISLQHPEMTGSEINEDRSLRKLNAVRLGVRSAMTYSYRQARYKGDWDKTEERAFTCAAILRRLKI